MAVICKLSLLPTLSCRKVPIKLRPDRAANERPTMKCQKCDKPATFHITDLVDGKPNELHLCEECAHKFLAPSSEGASESMPTMAGLLAQHLAAHVIGTVGLGSSKALLDALGLSPAQRAEFDASGAVGDVCARFYDLSGREVSSVVADRVLAVTLDDLRAIPVVAGVAAGAEKALGILGALHGRIIDVLICDQAAARSILTLENDGAAADARPGRR